MNTIRDSLFAVVMACLAGQTAAAHAADASPWADDASSSVRLIAGTNAGEDATRAGIEIKLQPGWKTYWRYPGDSGVPPRFDFSGSDNLASATVLYPAPHLFTDQTGHSLGYKDRVIFPVHVTATDKSKPVTLRLKLEYAVCEKLCIPAEARAELGLGAGSAEQAKAIAAAEARVPEKADPARVGLVAWRVSDAGKPLIMVELDKALRDPVELFVEGPTSEWALPIPKRKENAAHPGVRQFTFELDGLPPGHNPNNGVDLTFTIVAPDEAYEVKTRLDERR